MEVWGTDVMISNKIYDIKNLKVTQEMISFELSGTKIIVSLAQSGSKILPHAKLEHLQIFELDEDGIGIHWPVLDEDLSIAGLLRSAGKEHFVVKEIPSVYADETPLSTSDSPKIPKRHNPNKLTTVKL